MKAYITYFVCDVLFHTFSFLLVGCFDVIFVLKWWYFLVDCGICFLREFILYALF